MKTRAIATLLAILIAMAAAASAMADSHASALRFVRNAEAILYSNPQEASSLAARALRLCDTANPDSLCRRATMAYANAEQLLGNFDLSIRVLYDAEQMADTTDLPFMGRLWMLQGRVFSKLGDYKRSVGLNDRATALFKAQGDSAAVAACYNERGVTLLNMNENGLAERFFRKALDINRRRKNLQGAATNLNNMCLYPGDADEKLRMIDEAIAINRNLGLKWQLGENFNNKGKQLCYAGRYSDALKALADAKLYIDEIGARELLCDWYEYMGMAQSGAGNYAAAYGNMEKMVQLVAEIHRGNSQRNTEIDLSLKRHADQKRAALIKESDYRIKLLHRNLWMLFFGALLLILGGWYYYRRRKHRQDLQLYEARHERDSAEKEVGQLKLREQELQLENARNKLSATRQELTGFAAFLKGRNEMADRVREMLREGYRMEAALIPAHLKKINAFITSYTAHDKSSQTMLLKAEECNKEFMEALLQKHPGLTKGERNLALLIRGGLSTKDMAMLLGVEPKTVNMNRYRLRRSLELQPETDLHEYLQGL